MGTGSHSLWTLSERKRLSHKEALQNKLAGLFKQNDEEREEGLSETRKQVTKTWWLAGDGIWPQMDFCSHDGLGILERMISDS